MTKTTRSEITAKRNQIIALHDRINVLNERIYDLVKSEEIDIDIDVDIFIGLFHRKKHNYIKYQLIRIRAGPLSRSFYTELRSYIIKVCRLV